MLKSNGYEPSGMKIWGFAMQAKTIGLLGLVAALLLLLLAFLTTPIATIPDSDLVTSKAYFEDKSSTLDFVAIQQKPFAPYAGVFSQGYSSSNFWFRLTLDPSRAHAHSPLVRTDKIVLRIRPPYLREVELFDPAYPQERRRLSGDLYSASGDEYRSLNLSFVLPVGDGPRDVYVRMATSSSTLITFDAYSLEEVAGVDFRQGMFFTLYIAFLTLSLLLALFLLTMGRNKLVVLFVLRQSCGLIWALAIYGIYRYADFPYGPRPVTFMVGSVLWVTFISEIFDYYLFKTFRIPRLFSQIQILLMTFPIIGMGFAVFGEIRTAMIINIASALCFSIVTMLSSYFAFQRPAGEGHTNLLPKRVIIFSYTVICGFLLMTLFPQLGLYAGSEFAIYSIAFHTALSTILVSTFIVRRVKQFHDEKALLDTKLFRAQSALQIESEAREDQSALLAMLSHELKTPLAAMKMMLGAMSEREKVHGQMNTAIGEMNALIDRCLYAGKIEEGVIVVQKSPVDLGELLRERLLASESLEQLNVAIGNSLIIQTDAQLVGIILANLIENARKYSAHGKAITLQAERLADGGVAVTVANTPRLGRWPDRESLFRKYYRAATSHNVIGSGLGLFLSQRLAESLGGRITYEPTESEVRFRLWLPA
jgi:signal transduction histidine kinase